MYWHCGGGMLYLHGWELGLIRIFDEPFQSTLTPGLEYDYTVWSAMQMSPILA